jgi:triphosphoribosyl-dephospho-CoA synthase
MVAARAAEMERALDRSEKPDDAFHLLQRVDAEFKSNGINPGTTADLTVACLLAVRLEALLSHRKRRLGVFSVRKIRIRHYREVRSRTSGDA